MIPAFIVIGAIIGYLAVRRRYEAVRSRSTSVLLKEHLILASLACGLLTFILAVGGDDGPVMSVTDAVGIGLSSVIGASVGILLAALRRGPYASEQQLLRAIVSGDAVSANQAMQHGARVEIRDSETDRSALELALFHQRPELAKELLRRGAIATEEALNTSISSGSGELFFLLLQRGAHPTIETCKRAIERGHVALLKHMLQSQPNLRDQSLMSVAVGQRRRDAVETLRSFDMKLKKQHVFDAARSGNVEWVQAIVNETGTLNGRIGARALALAVSKKQWDVADLLMARGAVSDSDPNSALFHAIDANRPDLVEELLRRGADPNVVGTRVTLDTETALEVATRRMSLPMVKLLVQHGGDVNARNSRGRTALWAAIELHQKDIVRWLLDHGVDVNAKDSFGQTVFTHDYFQFDSYAEIRAILPEPKNG